MNKYKINPEVFSGMKGIKIRPMSVCDDKTGMELPFIGNNEEENPSFQCPLERDTELTELSSDDPEFIERKRTLMQQPKTMEAVIEPAGKDIAISMNDDGLSVNDCFSAARCFLSAMYAVSGKSQGKKSPHSAEKFRKMIEAAVEDDAFWRNGEK